MKRGFAEMQTLYLHYSLNMEAGKLSPEEEINDEYSGYQRQTFCLKYRLLNPDSRAADRSCAGCIVS